MATFTMSPNGRFPVAATATVYPKSNWLPHQLPPSGDPPGSSAASATIAADGSATFTGLAAATEYFVHVDVSGDDRYRAFTTDAESTVAETIKYAAIAEASSGNNEVVAAVTGKAIRVLAYVLVANDAVNAKWRSANTDKSGLLYLAANGGVAATGAPDIPLLETAAGEALNLNLSGAVAVGGHVTYVEV